MLLQIDIMEKCDLSNLASILPELIIENQNQEKIHIAQCPFQLPANQNQDPFFLVVSKLKSNIVKPDTSKH